MRAGLVAIGLTFAPAAGAQTLDHLGTVEWETEAAVGLSRMGGGDGVSGSGVLATFEFQAINPGDCGFAFVGASVKDPQARNLPAAFNTAAVRVE